MNYEESRCLICNYLKTYMNDFSISFGCAKDEDIYKCNKFISQEDYKRRRKLNKIYDNQRT